MSYNNKVIIEKAKNGKYTYKINIDGDWKYIYSKYSPKSNLIIQDIDDEKDIILIGLGLGYELQDILEKTSQDIYVIDKDDFLYNSIKEIDYMYKVIESKRVKFLFGDEYKKLICGKSFEYKILYNPNITQINSEYFSGVISKIRKTEKRNYISFRPSYYNSGFCRCFNRVRL